MVLVQKWPFFHLFFLRQNREVTCLLERKNAFVGYKNKKFKKSKNCLFCKGVNSQFMYKNGYFSNFFFLSKIGQENVFYDILAGKNTFQGYKTKNFKKQKNCYFSKEVNPWFWSKNGHFFNFFFLGNIGQGNVFYDILKGKNAFLGYKNKKLKKSKNCHYSKGVNPWFWSKNGHFFIFFFQALQAKKVSFTMFQNEKTPFQTIKKEVQKVEKLLFFQRG